MGELWRNYPATEHQQAALSAILPPTSPGGTPPNTPPTPRANKRPSQADLLLALLRARQAAGSPLELPEIRNLGIYQHTARIFELRERGFVIENEIKHAPDGSVQSFYRLVHDPELEDAHER